MSDNILTVLLDAKKELPAPEVEHPPPHVAAASLHRRKDRQSGACYEVDDATMKV